MKFLRKSIFGFLLLSLTSLELLNAQEIKDVIKPLRIKKDVTDTVLVSDLFYAEKYDLKLKDNKSLNAKLDGSSQKLIISPKTGFEGMTLLDFELNGKTYSIPVISRQTESSGDRIKHTFKFKPEGKPSKVGVFGSFNNWNKDNYTLSDKNSDGIYELEVSLDPGIYMYKFIVDGKEILDPLNPERAPTGFDDFNSVLTIADLQKEKSFLHTAGISEAKDKIKVAFLYEKNSKPGNLKSGEFIALLGNEKFADKNINISNGRIVITISKDQLKGEKTLRAAVSQNGRLSNIQNLQLIDGKPAGSGNHFAWNDGIIYSIMIDRFNDGDKSINNPIKHDSLFVQANYQGGDFEGIIKKLNEGYFDSLGINTLWISPVYDNPDVAFREYPKPHRWFSGYHGYWPVNNQGVEEEFGSMDKLKELVNVAHKHNKKVLLDIVAHHVHIDNPLFKEHPDWFGKLDLPDGRKNLRFWDEFRLTTWFEPYMPSFDYTSSKEAIDFMTENCVWWLNQTGADGFRHDAVKHVPNEFWRALTRRVKKEVESVRNLKVYQIGETFGDYDLVDSYVNNGQLDAQFNFNLSYFAVPVFAEDDRSFLVIDHQMKRTFETFGYNNLMGNIMDSHDKVRFMAYADGDVQKQGVDTREMAWSNPPQVDDPNSYKKAELCFTYLMTIPGLPVVYYGSEFGMTGADDPDNRRMMRFNDQLSDNEKQTLKAVSRVVNLRKDHPALRYGDFLTLKVDNSSYAYLRSDLNERILVVLNKKNTDSSIEVQLPEVYKNIKLTDLQTGQSAEYKNNKPALQVPAIGWKMYRVDAKL